jgi:hypothetical protein
MNEFARRAGPRALALLLPLAMFWLTIRGEATIDQKREVAASFGFAASPLPVLEKSNRNLRPVRPSVERFQGWISTVGAAVALHDADGDGLSNDAWYVDTRTDQVVVAPVPGSGERYPPFDLLAAPGCAARAHTAPMGVVPADLDEDGDRDAMVYFWGRSPLLYLRAAAGAPAAAAYECRELLATPEEWYSNAATIADFDGDGHIDLVIGNYFREGSGLLDPQSSSPEMQMQDSMSLAMNGGVDRMFLWTPQGFREAPGVFTEDVARGWTLALGAQDLDGDLLPELYMGNDFGPDRLLHNLSRPGQVRFELVEGKRRFTDPKSKVLGHDSFKGMGVDFADVSGDLVPDIFVSNITDIFALEEGTFLFLSGKKPLEYHDEAEKLGVARSGWCWDARFGDFDNDGSPEMLQATGFLRGTSNRWPELHELAMANDKLLRHEAAWPKLGAGDDLSGQNRNAFFARGKEGRYLEVAHELGWPEGLLSRGIATADVDGDGRLDLALGNQWHDSLFLRNVSPAAGGSLVLHLVLPAGDEPGAAATADLLAGGAARILPGPPALAGSPAIGARVVIKTAEGSYTAQVDGGNGHSGKRGPELHFGLGSAKDAEIEITWRDRSGQIRNHRQRLDRGVWTVLLAGREVT